jgi:hypothetical protein
MPRKLILSSSRRSRGKSAIVVTPLEAIMRLEASQRIRTIVLAGSYAADEALLAFLGDCYPAVRIECEA